MLSTGFVDSSEVEAYTQIVSVDISNLTLKHLNAQSETQIPAEVSIHTSACRREFFAQFELQVWAYVDLLK